MTGPEVHCSLPNYAEERIWERKDKRGSMQAGTVEVLTIWTHNNPISHTVTPKSRFTQGITGA